MKNKNTILIISVTIFCLILFYTNLFVENAEVLKIVNFLTTIVYYFGALTLGFIIDEIVRKIKNKDKMTLS